MAYLWIFHLTVVVMNAAPPLHAIEVNLTKVVVGVRSGRVPVVVSGML